MPRRPETRDTIVDIRPAICAGDRRPGAAEPTFREERNDMFTFSSKAAYMRVGSGLPCRIKTDTYRDSHRQPFFLDLRNETSPGNLLRKSVYAVVFQRAQVCHRSIEKDKGDDSYPQCSASMSAEHALVTVEARDPLASVVIVPLTG